MRLRALAERLVDAAGYAVGLLFRGVAALEDAICEASVVAPDRPNAEYASATHAAGITSIATSNERSRAIASAPTQGPSLRKCAFASRLTLSLISGCHLARSWISMTPANAVHAR